MRVRVIDVVQVITNAAANANPVEVWVDHDGLFRRVE
jgi:hypothetical protein